MIGRGIAARIALAALISAAVGLAILAVGVTVIGAESFKALMAEAGISADHAQQMYDQSVSTVVVAAVVVAAARQHRPGGADGPDARPAAGRDGGGRSASGGRRLRGQGAARRP